jgi:hypothetical protein
MTKPIAFNPEKPFAEQCAAFKPHTFNASVDIAKVDLSPIKYMAGTVAFGVSIVVIKIMTELTIDISACGMGATAIAIMLAAGRVNNIWLKGACILAVPALLIATKLILPVTAAAGIAVYLITKISAGCFSFSLGAVGLRKIFREQENKRLTAHFNSRLELYEQAVARPYRPLKERVIQLKKECEALQARAGRLTVEQEIKDELSAMVETGTIDVMKYGEKFRASLVKIQKAMKPVERTDFVGSDEVFAMVLEDKTNTLKLLLEWQASFIAWDRVSARKEVLEQQIKQQQGGCALYELRYSRARQYVCSSIRRHTIS